MDKGPYGSPPGELLLLLTDGVLPVILVVGILAYMVFRVSRGISSPSGSGRAGAALLEALSMLAVGVLIALFVGFGIEAFYPSPALPFGPDEEVVMEEGPNGEFKKGPPVKSKADFDRKLDVYKEQISGYNQISGPIALGLAVLILASVFFLKRLSIPTIRDGVALGGVLTLFYGLSLALQTEGGIFRFLMVAVTLLVVLAAVYLRFRSREDASP